MSAQGLGRVVNQDVRVAFIGAGGVNFGSPEGPWNHAARLERLHGLEFSAVVDPIQDLARQRIGTHKKGPHANKWSRTLSYPDYHSMLDSQAGRPDCAIIGLAPNLHGSLDDPEANIESVLAKAGVHLFVEKPLSVLPIAEVRRLRDVLVGAGVIISVGYMLRYSAAVRAAERILAEEGSRPAALVARYATGYSHIRKQDWWDIAQSGGPIVEQATHFVDLMRLFGGEARPDTIRSLAVGPDLPLSDMVPPPAAEHGVPFQRRINRATAAMWRTEHGAVASLTHTALLHGSRFAAVFEIYADGLHIIIDDPYNDPRLLVRRPKQDDYHEVPLDTSVDMYEAEFSAFVEAVRTGSPSGVRSPYADAVHTYELTRLITAAASTMDA